MAVACSISLTRLVPLCPSCRTAYDCYRAPQVLPCGHTYCAVCLRHQQKKRCFHCSRKYRNFSTNVALKDMVANLQYLSNLEAEKSQRCEECERRVPLRFMRTCLTCKEGIQKIVQHDLLQCHMCLECCVNRHNGHDLVPISYSLNRRRLSETTCSEQPQTPKSPRFYSTVIDLADPGPLPNPVCVQNDTYFATSSHYINVVDGPRR